MEREEYIDAVGSLSVLGLIALIITPFGPETCHFIQANPAAIFIFLVPTLAVAVVFLPILEELYKNIREGLENNLLTWRIVGWGLTTYALAGIGGVLAGITGDLRLIGILESIVDGILGVIISSISAVWSAIFPTLQIVVSNAIILVGLLLLVAGYVIFLSSPLASVWLQFKTMVKDKTEKR